MNNGSAEFLNKKEKMYADLEEVLVWLKEMMDKNKFPLQLTPLLFEIFCEMVRQKSLPVALLDKLVVFNENALGAILPYLDEIKTAQKNESRSTVVIQKQAVGPISPKNSDLPKPVPAISKATRKKKPSEVFSARSGEKPASQHVDAQVIKLDLITQKISIESNVALKIENTKLSQLVDMLAGREQNFHPAAWDNSSDEILEIRNRCRSLRKIRITEKKEKISLADDSKIYRMTYIAGQNCSMFIWTLNERICYWSCPETVCLEDLMSKEGIELEELRALVIIRQPENDILEMDIQRFSRK